MQIIYLAPFILLSAIAGTICLIVPKWRRHVFTAASAPLAFGFFSIVGALVVVLAVNQLVNISLDRIWGYVIVLVAYAASGVAGVLLVRALAARVRRWL